MVDHAILTSNRWEDDKILDIHQEMMQLTLGIICKSVLNYEIEGEAHKVGNALTTFRSSGSGGSGVFLLALSYVLRGILHRFRGSGTQKDNKALTTSSASSLWLQNSLSQVLDKIHGLDKRADSFEARMQLDSIIYRIIADTRKTGKGDDDSNNADLLSRLIQAADTGKMSDLQLRDEIMTIFVAGHETTANALTWTFYLLSRNPIVEENLHSELDSILDSGNVTPSVEDIRKLHYTENIFRESLRLFPPIWSIRRNVKDDFRLGHYTLPAGSSIIMSPFVMHHDLRYYSEPERFDPGRWTEEFKKCLPRFSYFPFGGGPRSCIGEPFAWVEGVLIIATLAQKWMMRLIPDQNIRMDPGSVLRPKYGIKMKVKLRKQN
jgi:cytochrome P450